MTRHASAAPVSRFRFPGKRVVVLALSATALIYGASAQALTDRADLEKWCGQGSAVAAGRCLGYLLAAEDALSSNSIDSVRACLPRSIGLAEQHRIVMAWLRAHPDAVATTAIGLVAQAYAASYPCPP